VKWTTLNQPPDDSDTTWIDELISSSPGNWTSALRQKENSSQKRTGSRATEYTTTQGTLITPMTKVNGASTTPLFIASDTQPTSPQHVAFVNGESSPLATSQLQQHAISKTTLRPVSSWNIPRLSDIASQAMFSPLTSHPIPVFRTGQEAKMSGAFNAFEDDDDDSDSDSSDSESEKASHIPKDRRAGVQKT